MSELFTYRVKVKQRVDLLIQLLRFWALPYHFRIGGRLGNFDFLGIPENHTLEVYKLTPTGTLIFHRLMVHITTVEDREKVIRLIPRIGIRAKVDLVQISSSEKVLFVAYDGFIESECFVRSTLDFMDSLREKKIIRNFLPVEPSALNISQT